MTIVRVVLAKADQVLNIPEFGGPSLLTKDALRGIADRLNREHTGNVRRAWIEDNGSTLVGEMDLAHYTAVHNEKKTQRGKKR